ncbi:MAG: GNAT family N-acetyltransferase [Actinomycetota bacterium]
MTGRIRRASTTDLGGLAAVETAAGARFRELGLDSIADDPGPSIADLAPHLDDGTIWVAEEAGVVVGYATASIVDGEGHLDQVSVVPDAGGNGYGAALIAEVHRWAAADGLPSVTLTTFRDVAWNGPYYERLGYRPLADDELGPELSAVRQAEIDAGLDVLARVAMRLDLKAPPVG